MIIGHPSMRRFNSWKKRSWSSGIGRFFLHNRYENPTHRSPAFLHRYSSKIRKNIMTHPQPCFSMTTKKHPQIQPWRWREPRPDDSSSEGFLSVFLLLIVHVLSAISTNKHVASHRGEVERSGKPLGRPTGTHRAIGFHMNPSYESTGFPVDTTGDRPVSCSGSSGGSLWSPTG